MEFAKRCKSDAVYYYTLDTYFWDFWDGLTLYCWGLCSCNILHPVDRAAIAPGKNSIIAVETM